MICSIFNTEIVFQGYSCSNATSNVPKDMPHSALHAIAFAHLTGKVVVADWGSRFIIVVLALGEVNGLRLKQIYYLFLQFGSEISTRRL